MEAGMNFQSPVGSPEEIASGVIWPGRWSDATPYLSYYILGYHTGADLNLNYPHWNSDQHKKVFAMGKGRVTYARLYSQQYWGKIIVIDHGMLENAPLFSRYGHVENLRVAEGDEVETGQHIANVGNGEGLFPYHLHFDISRTDILANRPSHWPGSSIQLVRAHYVDPKQWLQNHMGDGVQPIMIPATTRVVYVIATIGLRVRKNHSTTSKQVGSFVYGTRVTIEQQTVDDGPYTWGHISGGNHNGDWMALGSIDQSELFVSPDPPTMWS
jgi:hypothetical protein